MTPSSYGEALDRLTILELKLSFIKDTNRLTDVQRERDELWNIVKDFIAGDQFHYDKLLEVNRIMWNIQDILHTNKALDTENELSLMRKLAVENQRRFRLKRTINENLGSRHREQKGYKGKRAFVLSHLGMGDHFFMNGAVRYLASFYDEVCVVVKEPYLQNLKQLYLNEPAVTFHVVHDDKDISPQFGCPFDTFKNATYDFDFVGLCGYHAKRTADVSENFPLQFYKDLNIPPEVIHTWSNIPSVGTDGIHEPHIFYHNKASNYEAQIPIQIEECLVINPSECMYPEGHKWYGAAKSWVNRPIMDYVGLMRTSKRMLMTDSSFFCMALMMGLSPEVWSRDGRTYRRVKPDLVEHCL